MKIIFAGTPEVSTPALKALCDSEHDVVAVLTRPDAPQGRKKVLTPSPVAILAQERGIPLLYANSIDEALTQAIVDTGAELGVVVAYGALFPQQTLDSIEHGWINLHFSALPLWRGAAPVQWQILSGSSTAGSTVFSLVRELDAGDVFDIRQEHIGPDETSGELLTRLSLVGSNQVISVVNAIAAGEAEKTPQVGEPSYARKLSSEDGHLNFSDTAQQVYNQHRGVTPEPGSFVLVGEDRLKVIEARLSITEVPQGLIKIVDKQLYLGCSSGSLLLLRVQPFGKQPMNALDWFRGLRLEEVRVS